MQRRIDESLCIGSNGRCLETPPNNPLKPTRLARENAVVPSQARCLLTTQRCSTVTLSDEHIAEVESFGADVRDGLDNTTFEDQRRYFELLDMRGRLARENGEKVIYAKCRPCE